MRWRWRPKAAARMNCRRHHRSRRRVAWQARISPPPCRTCDARTFSSGAMAFRCLLYFGCADFEVAVALSAVVAACDGPAKHTHSPVASINAERPLALIIIWQSPHLPVPRRERRPARVSTARQKKGIFGRTPGENRAAAFRTYARFRRAAKSCVRESMPRVQPGPNDVMSLRGAEFAVATRGAKREYLWPPAASITTS